MRQGTELDLWCKKQCHWVEAWVSKNAEWTSLLLDSDLKQICKAIFPMLYLGFYERALLCIEKFKKTTDQRLKCHFYQIRLVFSLFWRQWLLIKIPHKTVHQKMDIKMLCVCNLIHMYDFQIGAFRNHVDSNEGALWSDLLMGLWIKSAKLFFC